ncbi:MAG: lamin tail domain-containing protein, partial [bacterium]
MKKLLTRILLLFTVMLPLSVMAGSTNTTPYAEGFEGYWRGFSLAGTNGWEAGAGSSAVVTNTLMGGTFKYFQVLDTSHDYCLGIDGWVTNHISSPSNTHIWAEMLLPPLNQRVYVGGADGTEYFSFWSTNSGQWVVHHSYLKGARGFSFSSATNVYVATGEWVRVSLDQDYAATSAKGYNSFRILVNGQPLRTSNQYTNSSELGLGSGGGWFAMLVSNTDAMGMICVGATNGTGYLEDLAVRTNTPDFSAITRGQVSISGVDTNAEVMGFKPGICRVTLDSGATNRYIWVTYNIGGTAVPYQDYVPMSSVVGIPPGATNADIQVIPRKGPTGDREVLITLVSNVYTTVGTPSSAVVRIVNEIASVAGRQKGPCSRMTGLTISEIMYHPALRSDGRDGEFVELFNSEPVDADLSGYRLTGDIAYTFATGTVIKARSWIVVAKDISAYLNIPDVFGPFTGSLNNGGGVVSLKNASGAMLLTAEFSGSYPWPASADGSGHSLTLAKPDYGEGDMRAWSASSEKGGSPGGSDSYRASSYDGLVINELVVHTDPPLVDSIELFNSSSNTININGCWLSDDPGTNKFRITNGATLGPRSFINFTQTNFVFGLSMAGGGVYLVSSNDDRVIDAVKYSAQSNGASLGRYPDGTSGFQTLVSRTLGSSNA